MYRFFRLRTVFLFASFLAPALAEPCLVTLAPSPSFVPPEPYDASPGNDGFWFGSDHRWLKLPIVLSTKYGQKLFVWSNNFKDPYREQRPALVVTGRRLDGNTDPFVAQNATNAIKVAGGPAMLIGIAVPTAGCWELTTFYQGAVLRFVVLVQD